MAHTPPVPPEHPRDPSPGSRSRFHWIRPSGHAVTGALPALAFRDFRIFWFGQLISLTGTWIQTVAQQWLVLKLTGSAFALGLVTTVQFTPMLMLALVGGAISDRVSKRNLLLATQMVSCMLAVLLGLLVSTGRAQYWQVLVIAGVLGTVNAFYVPARQAFVPELVDKATLLNAVALNSAIFNGARVVGPAIGGILIATIGLSLNFYLNAVSFLAVIAGLLFIRPQSVSRDLTDRNLWRDVANGLRYIRDTPVVYSILALVGVSSLFALNFTSLLPLFARYVLHVGSSGFGFLSASMGVGSLSGAITLSFFKERRHVKALIYGGILTFTAAEILFSFSRVYGLSLCILALVGISMTLFTTTANTRILSMTPSHLQGRVMSVYSLMFLGMTPFGSFLSGLVAERFGAPTALAAGGTITLLFAVFMLLYRPSERGERRLQQHRGA